MKNFKIKKIELKVLFICLLFLIFIILLIYLLYVPKIKLVGKDSVIISYDEQYKESGYKAYLFGLDVSNKVKIESNVDYGKVGNYEIKYTIKNILGCFDNSVIRKISIVDNENPEIKLIGKTVLLKLGNQYHEPGYEALDNYDGNITSNVTIKNNVDPSKVGEYEVNYSVSDSSKNESFATRKVIVYETNSESIPILTYHNFMSVEEKNKYASENKYIISNKLFEDQLKYLKNNGYNTITLEDLYLWYTGEKVLSDKDVVIVIDDGSLSAYVYAIPLLEKYDYKASIFVITGRITNVKQEWNPSQFMYFNEEIIADIRENHKNISLSSHTHNLHSKIDGRCAIASMNEDQIYDDVVTSKNIIKSDFLAYPYGCNTPSSKIALEKAGYKMAFEFGDNKRATKNDDIYSMKRLNINDTTTMAQFISWLNP